MKCGSGKHLSFQVFVWNWWKSKWWWWMGGERKNRSSIFPWTLNLLSSLLAVAQVWTPVVSSSALPASSTSGNGNYGYKLFGNADTVTVITLKSGITLPEMPICLISFQKLWIWMIEYWHLIWVLITMPASVNELLQKTTRLHAVMGNIHFSSSYMLLPRTDQNCMDFVHWHDVWSMLFLLAECLQRWHILPWWLGEATSTLTINTRQLCLSGQKIIRPILIRSLLLLE